MGNKRADAVRIRELDGFHSIVPYVMPKRTEAEVSSVETFDVTDLLAYLRRRSAQEGKNLKLFHAVCTAALRTIWLRPKMNIFIAGRRFWQRRDITLSFVAKQRFDDAAEEVLLFLKIEPDMTLDDISKIILGDVKTARTNRGKDLDKTMTEEANRIVMTLEHRHEHKSIVLFNEEWHRGIIGIVASRLTEVFYKPSVVLTEGDDGMATGSARSVPGFDVHKAIESCADLLTNFGGHTYAAGLSMPVENVPAFRRRFEEYVEQHIQPEQTSAILRIDTEVDFRDINRRMAADIKRFAPYGPDNQKPLFCTRQVYDYGTSKVVGRDQEHIKLELVDSKSSNVINGIAFGQSSQARYIKTKRAFDIVYNIEENSHKHGEVQLVIEDIKPCE